MDRILIRDLLVRCVLGVTEEERRDKQDVIINIAISADLSGPSKSDRFEDAIDYSAMKKRVMAVVKGSGFHLLEALAQRIAEVCLENPAVRQVQVTVDKPTALRFARSVAVEITRSR